MEARCSCYGATHSNEKRPSRGLALSVKQRSFRKNWTRSKIEFLEAAAKKFAAAGFGSATVTTDLAIPPRTALVPRANARRHGNWRRRS